MVRLRKVLEVLNEAAVGFVLAGAHALGGWTRKPRAAVDVDVVVAPRSHRKAVRAIRETLPSLTVRVLEVVTRMIDPATNEAVIDLMKPRDKLMPRTSPGSWRQIPTSASAVSAGWLVLFTLAATTRSAGL